MDPKVGRVIPNAPVGVAPTENAFPQRRRLPHLAPSWVPAGEIYFITICCAQRATNQLANPETFGKMVAAWEHHIAAQNIWLTLFLAMPDHLHLLASFPRQVEMAQFIRNWKRFIAKQADVAWQPGFFDHRLRNNESLEEKSNYIRLNPVRAGLAPAPNVWNYVWPDCNAASAR